MFLEEHHTTKGIFIPLEILDLGVPHISSDMGLKKKKTVGKSVKQLWNDPKSFFYPPPTSLQTRHNRFMSYKITNGSRMQVIL